MSNQEISKKEETKHRFTEDDLDNVWGDYKYYLVQILNKEYKLEEAIDDLLSLIGSDYDPRN